MKAILLQVDLVMSSFYLYSKRKKRVQCCHMKLSNSRFLKFTRIWWGEEQYVYLSYLRNSLVECKVHDLIHILATNGTLSDDIESINPLIYLKLFKNLVH